MNLNEISKTAHPRQKKINKKSGAGVPFMKFLYDI
jgi:hypothetical protein